MQTFLPYSNFVASARTLDTKRLGKQRVEAYQILRTLVGESEGWKNHPAVKMWRGYEGALARYAVDVCLVWREKGYRDTILSKVLRLCDSKGIDWRDAGEPWWLGEEKFHAAHRQTLLSKNPTHYGQFGWQEEAKYEYWWPSQEMENHGT